MALDAKNQAVIVSDKELNAVLTFYAPEIFDAPIESRVRR